MIVDNGILQRRYEERPHPSGLRLGRHMELDARSLEHLIEETTQPIKPAEWLPPIPTLDQGQLGSCTGNAGTYHLSALYGKDYNTFELGQTFFQLDQDAAINERFAVELYHEATQKDGFQGTYPPDDSGSSGLGVCRALKADKLIGRYVWSTTARSVGTALQRAGVIIGVPWYNAWFNPDSNGFIDAGNWKASGIAGGHELYVEALEAWDDHDLSKCILRFHNSWADSWGDKGCGRLRLSTYQELKGQIDVKQFLPAV